MAEPIAYWLDGGTPPLLHMTLSWRHNVSLCGQRMWSEANAAEIARHPMCRECMRRMSAA